ncbi:ABC transporter permease subunit [Aquicoccus sp. SCR17]|nr:ABC transporter permease subunit [Carideicomes alvinocaridis]
MRAAIVGMLNTLIVAGLGCITATIFGVIAGVLRLSNNWIVRKLMAVYVEMFRNVPVLIWILIIFSIMSVALPAPSAFRGAEPDSSMLFGLIALTNRGVYVPNAIPGAGAMVVTAVFLLSLVGVWAYRRYATKKLYDTGQLLPMGWPSLVILIVPTLLVWMFFTLGSGTPNRIYVPSDLGGDVSLEEYAAEQGTINLCSVAGEPSMAVAKRRILRAEGATLRSETYPNAQAAAKGFADGNCDMLVLPEEAAASLVGQSAELTTHLRRGGPFELEVPYLAGFNFTDGVQVRGSLIALWFALAVYTGAFIAENVRAGIMAISRGQSEAAAALGLRPRRIMSLVILPQALRVIIPPVISQYLNLTKNSSLAIAVGYMDLTGTLGGITLNQTGRAIESVFLLMLFYLAISLAISGVMNAYNNAVRLKER